MALVAFDTYAPHDTLGMPQRWAAAGCRVEDDGLPCDGVHYAVFSLWKGAAGMPWAHAAM